MPLGVAFVDPPISAYLRVIGAASQFDLHLGAGYLISRMAVSCIFC
jgi:hypothetical protein